MEKKSMSPKIPSAPPVPEEPLEKMPHGKLICEICGKTLKVHSELDSIWRTCTENQRRLIFQDIRSA
jgi:hypothetical protein